MKEIQQNERGDAKRNRCMGFEIHYMKGEIIMEVVR